MQAFHVLSKLPALYAPTKVVLTLGDSQFAKNPQIPAQIIKPLLASRVIAGAGVFSADQSSTVNPANSFVKQCGLRDTSGVLPKPSYDFDNCW